MSPAREPILQENPHYRLGTNARRSQRNGAHDSRSMLVYDRVLLSAIEQSAALIGISRELLQQILHRETRV